MNTLTITVLGPGTSMGVPTTGCSCRVCKSGDLRDKRMRPSILLRWGEHTVLIDSGPDFRQQALQFGIEHVDAVLYTHAHADHIMGLDDIRPISLRQRDAIPLYGSNETLATIERCFSYAFNGAMPGTLIPRLSLHSIEDHDPELFGVRFERIPVLHGQQTIYGFRFGRCAYITDQSLIPSNSVEKLAGLDVLFLDALRHKPHPTHSSLQQALAYVEQIRPRRAYFTHISHDLGHEQTNSTLPDHVRLAYDGLSIAVEDGV
jgi:phosphoribosyl 1,2-cyclic phosphate phosphodiesterase